MTKKTWIALLIALTFTLTGCGEDEKKTPADTTVIDATDTAGDTTPDTSPAACGEVTLLGECDEQGMLRYCDNGALVVEDCAERFDGAAGACTLISDAYGYDCAVTPGSSCVGSGAGGFPIFQLCAGDEAGCVIDTAGGGVCTSNLGTCSFDGMAVGDEYTCVGNNVAFICQNSQPVAVDCSLVGGTCVSTPGVCANIPVDGTCNTNTEQGFYICATGLTCEAEEGAALGTCQMP